VLHDRHRGSDLLASRPMRGSRVQLSRLYDEAGTGGAKPLENRSVINRAEFLFTAAHSGAPCSKVRLQQNLEF